jgi:hypothetical protein
MKFRFNKDFVIDSDVEPWRREGLRIAMLGGPGSGKSWNNSLIAEQFLIQGGTVIIFQPRDEYFTLKEKFDVLSVGGVHAKDMEFALTAPSIYAKAVVEDGMSMIFYTSAADEEKLIEWVSRFIRHILNYQERHKRPILLILEEAQEYAPRTASGHVAPPWVYNRMIKAFKDCFTQGRKLNIIAIASSQRPQELNFTIRQLANLTFYGKFSDQDIGYVDKECLKYVRKRGIEIDASRLVELGLGEWLVIMGKQSRFITVTEQRLTKHGAETPRLEYVAPRTIQVKKTIDQLSKAIMEALRKEEAGKSELEKAKRRIKDLEKKLEAAEEKAKIKLSVKEMLKAGPESTELAEKLAEAETQIKEFEKLKQSWETDHKELLKELDAAQEEINKLKLEMKDLEDFKKSFQRLFLPSIPKYTPTSTPTAVPSEVAVDIEQPALIVNVRRKKLELTDESLEGKIAIVYAEGKLPKDKWFTTTDVTHAFISHGWPKDPRTGPTLDKFCQWGFFEKHYAGKRPEYRIKISPDQAREKGLLKEIEV